MFGHIDEIGLVVNHIDDEGFLWFGTVGGWDPEVLVGQRRPDPRRGGPLPGVIGKKARHHQDAADREKPSRIRDLWIDIGASSATAAGELAAVGDLAVLEQPAIDARQRPHRQPRRRQPLRRLRRRRGRAPVRRVRAAAPA